MVSTTIAVMGEDLQLHHFSLSKDETNTAIIAHMREISVQDLSITHDFAKKIKYALLMRKPAVGKGLMLKVSTPRNRSRSAIDNNSCRRVISKLNLSLLSKSIRSRKTIR